MNQPDYRTQKLQEPVEQILKLLAQEAAIAGHFDTSAVQTSLRKAISPTFEIVFAGVFSAGKSMLINALLERELLYSAEGHATGTECQIAYAESNQERVLLTFLSQAEIQEQVDILCQQLNISLSDICDPKALQDTHQKAIEMIRQEGGENKSERAKRAAALQYLLQGFQDNRQYIEAAGNTVLSMEQIQCSSLQQAASYARRGSNSATLKRVEYYCHHPLLKDGNVFVDTPGIDAPVKKDAEWTYRKIESPDISAVICVLKPASAGDLTSEETELLEKTRSNPGIRDRVFYVFNRIDESWYNAQLKQRLDRLIQDQFYDSHRVFKTSGLLGFYGSQIRQTTPTDRYGLDSFFAESVRQAGGVEETPQFVNEFNRYCANSGKLPPSRFRIEVKSYESANDNYIRILNEGGSDLIEQLIQDSGIETFRTAITRYLTEEKRPLLLKNLVEDLTPICTKLRQFYLETGYALQSQPQNVETLKEQGLSNLSKDLKEVGDNFCIHIEEIINEITASSNNSSFEGDFRKLKAKMVSRLDELLNTFSVSTVHQRAQASHRRNTVVPLLGILAEAFYYLANGLEDVLVEASQVLAANFFRQLYAYVKKRDYYHKLHYLLGNDSGIEQALSQCQQQVAAALRNEARVECDRYVRERPEFFAEETTSIFQLRQTLQQACRGYDYQNMVEAEPAIRYLLKLDFEEKVKDTILKTFRQTINQTLNHHLLSVSQTIAETILTQYDHAHTHLISVLEKEALEKVHRLQQQQAELQDKITLYNESIEQVNSYLVAMNVEQKTLVLVKQDEFKLSKE